MPQARRLSALEYQVVEEMRGIGNWQFKEKLYIEAIHTYVYCLSYMGISQLTNGVTNSGQKTSKEVANEMPTQYNEQAAFLYLNIGQSSLNLEARHPSKCYGSAAALASYQAVRFLSDVFDGKRHEIVPGDDIERTIDQHMERLMKAYLRLGRAELICANYPAAVNHLTILLDCAHACEHLCDIDALGNQVEAVCQMLKRYLSTDHTVKVPRQVITALERAAGEVFGRAEIRNVAWEPSIMRLQFKNMDTVDKVFSCGAFHQWQIFIARQPHNAKYCYFICGFRMVPPDGPSMCVLDMLSCAAEKGIYSSGAMVGDCLYLIAEPAMSPDLMLCLQLQKDDGTSYPAKEVFTTGRPMECMHSSFVSDGKALYLFGGCTLKNGATSAHNTLYKLTPRPGSTHDNCLQWKVMPAATMPPARFGHGSWVYEGQLYVYGGVEAWARGDRLPADFRTLSGMTQHPLRTLDDVWRYDLKAHCWKELEPKGTMPAGRAHMGVAIQGAFAIISGGVTGHGETKRKLQLADVWVLNTFTGTWMQVVPAESQGTWMSARYSHASAIVDGHLCTLGGHFSMSENVSLTKGLCFKHTRFSRDSTISFAPNGAERDKALERVCEAMAQFKGLKSQLPAWRQLLAATKTGCCMMYTQDVSQLAACILTPTVIEGMPPHFRGILFPVDMRYGPKRSAASSQGECSEEGYRLDPFHPTPRHLTGPCELQVHLEASSSSRDPWSRGTTAISTTLKVFGTVKAAVVYWWLTMPLTGRKQGWSTFEDVTPRDLAKELQGKAQKDHAEKFTELAFFLRQNPDNESEDQLYILSVTGHIYTAHLITHLSAGGNSSTQDRRRWTMKLCTKILELQHSMIFKLRRKTPCACLNCGHKEILPLGGRADTMKVCKGCRLVRFCSLQCQREAWPLHKLHCTP